MKNIKTILTLAAFPLFFPCKSTNDFKGALQASKSNFENIKIFYDKMQGQPVWFFQGHLTKCGQVAMETLQNAHLDGLNALDYNDITRGNPPEKWIHNEFLLTQRFLEYISHLKGGRIDPEKISRDIKFHNPRIVPTDTLTVALANHGSGDCHNLKRLSPALPQYIQLKKILSDYRERFKDSEIWPRFKASTPLKSGDISPEILNLRKILFLHGDLEDEEPSLLFDESVDAALRQFQKRFTLEADGIAGGKTSDALNLSGDDLIRKVIINMERLRWLPNDLGRKYIIVNVAGYEVQGFENSRLKITIPAIVGRPSRRTPLFYASMKNIVINPSWGVPYNILIQDKIPKIIKDPDYLTRLGFTVTDEQGSAVNPDEADWQNEGTRYRLRQSPGHHNALGSIKFNIDNPYIIYLHGTPEENLFAKTARAFSSGCIRLKSPADLAEWVLNDEEHWSKEEIEEAIYKNTTRSITLPEDIRVFFIYQTVWQGEDNLVHVSDDPYRLDAKMAKVLHNASLGTE